MYAVYRVITALVLSGLLIAILHDDFFYSRLSIPLETMLMHYGYWSFLLLTVDFLLQVKLGTLTRVHGPCLSVYGPWTQALFWTPVCSPAVDTGSLYRALDSWPEWPRADSGSWVMGRCIPLTHDR